MNLTQNDFKFVFWPKTQNFFWKWFLSFADFLSYRIKKLIEFVISVIEDCELICRFKDKELANKVVDLYELIWKFHIWCKVWRGFRQNIFRQFLKGRKSVMSQLVKYSLTNKIIIIKEVQILFVLFFLVMAKKKQVFFSQNALEYNFN